MFTTQTVWTPVVCVKLFGAAAQPTSLFDKDRRPVVRTNVAIERPSKRAKPVCEGPSRMACWSADGQSPFEDASMSCATCQHTDSVYSADHRGLNAVNGAFIRSTRPGPVGKPDNMPACVPATSVSPCQLELLLSQFCGLNTLPAVWV